MNGTTFPVLFAEMLPVVVLGVVAVHVFFPGPPVSALSPPDGVAGHEPVAAPYCHFVAVC
jgi:hypothetical protein